MRTQVRIFDHLTKKDHVSTWCVDGYGLAAVQGAVHAAFVRAYGTSAGRIEIRSLDETCESGELYAKGMRVSVASISDQVPLLSHLDAERRKEQRALKSVAA